MSSSPRRIVYLSAAAAALLVAAPVYLGCSASRSADPAVPSPSGQAAADCRTLHSRLPEKVEGQQRVEPEPKSVYTAVWGDPAIELRCGVPRPEVLTPGSEHYNPTTEAVEVNGVEWLLEEQPDGYRFTTIGRTAFVELTVPGVYAPEVGVLTDFANAVRGAVPKDG
ncbi:DUF3515 domain-containing protein [Streptomyces gobiensis]|uniref:DUF3515 domain-containing protein n=1 Tax=Streptomyces gobiensis TaxID=2875706 RepID=UPI001E5D3C7C|nr:DUF3515 domain-containing protein [Streptomyces gobiensis]UGY93803.1 DUF3515 domain-containing protein [Streptomyces gobiensis]